MKPSLFVLVGFCFLFGLSSCGDLESDAQRVADYACKVRQAGVQALSGKIDADQVQKLQRESQQLTQEMARKYNTPDAAVKFAQAVQEKMGDCR